MVSFFFKLLKKYSMKTLFMGLFSSLFFFSLSAQTRIADGTLVEGSWTKASSPYILEGVAIVAEGATLKIEKGVVVQCKTGVTRDFRDPSFDLGVLMVYGTLLAEGTKKELIRFTRQGNLGNWGCIFIDRRSVGSKLSYCKIEYAYHVRDIADNDNATGALSIHQRKDIIVENCLFVNNGWTGINCKQGATPTIRFCTIAFNQYGVECNSDSGPHFESCIIWGNTEFYFLNGESRPRFSKCFVQESFGLDVEQGRGNTVGSRLIFKDLRNNDYEVVKKRPWRPFRHYGAKL